MVQDLAATEKFLVELRLRALLEGDCVDRVAKHWRDGHADPVGILRAGSPKALPSRREGG